MWSKIENHKEMFQVGRYVWWLTKVIWIVCEKKYWSQVRWAIKALQSDELGSQNSIWSQIKSEAKMLEIIFLFQWMSLKLC